MPDSEELIQGIMLAVGVLSPVAQRDPRIGSAVLLLQEAAMGKELRIPVSEEKLALPRLTSALLHIVHDAEPVGNDFIISADLMEEAKKVLLKA